MFGATWFNLGDLYCMQSYPVESQGSVPTIPTPGNVTVVLTNQCSQYTYGPQGGQDSVTMYTLTDTFGNVYALQTATQNATSPQDWQALVENTEYPPGWTIDTEILTEPEMHYSYVIGNDCWLIVLKDASGNAWQQYKYGQPLESSEFLGSMPCPPLAKSVPTIPPPMPPTPTPTPSPPSAATMMMGTSPSSVVLHLLAFFVALFLALRA